MREIIRKLRTVRLGVSYFLGELIGIKELRHIFEASLDGVQENVRGHPSTRTLKYTFSIKPEFFKDQ